MDENKRGAVGVGGVRKFTFHVTGEGEGNLNFLFGRPWEINSQVQAGQSISTYVQKVIPINAVPRKSKDL